MSILYHKRAKKVIKWTWAIFALIIVISMVFTYSAGLGV